MTENSRLAMYRNELASALGTTDLPDWDVLEQWLVDGADFWRDMLPTIRTILAKRRQRGPGWYPRRLSYFTEAVIEANLRRRILSAMATKPTSARPSQNANSSGLGPAEKAERVRIVRVMRAAEKAKVPQGEAAERRTGHGSRVPDPNCACIWCGAPFRPLGASGKKRFCSDRCRAAYHRGCRVWAMRAVDEGQLSMDAIRSASRKPYTDFPGASGPTSVDR
jgi:hypothetical protein